MTTLKNISLKDGKLNISESGIELKKDNRVIGTRMMLDTYNPGERENIISYLSEEVVKLEAAKDVCSKAIEEGQKKFDKREANKIKELKDLLAKMEGFNKVQQEKDRMKNIMEAIERDNKDIAELKALVESNEVKEN